MLDRTQSPKYKEISGINLIEPKSYAYDNGLKAFVFSAPDQTLLKAEFIFANTFDLVENPLLNTALSSLIKEGTFQMNSAEIAEHVDFYGAYLIPEYSYDHTSITVYTLKKYASKIFPLIKDILTNAVIPEKELQTYIRNNKQSLQVSLEKNDFVARKQFYKSLFGNSRYGISPTKEGLEALHRTDLLELYQHQMQPSNCTLILAGGVDDELVTLISQYFGEEWSGKDQDLSFQAPAFPISSTTLILEQREESLQSAIRLGCKMINRSHPDYAEVQFVNTFFGGFFGSRLMRNIREEKGYTYSIGSGIVSLKHAGFLTIASEVGVDVTSATMTEIEKEFHLLRSNLPQQDEVNLVRNYMLGSLLGSLESIFSHADKFKAIYFNGLDSTYYDQYTKKVQNITAKRVQEIAQQYFDYDQLTKIVVGKL